MSDFLVKRDDLREAASPSQRRRRSSRAKRCSGRAGLEQRVADVWHPFCEWIGERLEVVHGQGFDTVREAYPDVLEGRVAPNTAHVISLV